MARQLLNTPTESTGRFDWYEEAFFAKEQDDGLRILLRELPTGPLTVFDASDIDIEINLPPKEVEIQPAESAVSDTFRVIGITQRQQDIMFLLHVNYDEMKFRFRVWFDPHSSNLVVENGNNENVELRCLHGPEVGVQESLPLLVKRTTLIHPGLWELCHNSMPLFQCAVLERKLPRVINAEQEAEEAVETQARKRQRTERTNQLQQKATNSVEMPQTKHPFSLQRNETLILPGTSTDESYELTFGKEIASTGSGRVYEAWHNKAKRWVAVKSYAPLTTEGPEPETSNNIRHQIMRASREYSINSRLTDKTIVQTHGWDARYLCLYMELIPGSDLGSGTWRDQQWNFRGGRVHVEQILLDISRALEHIHRKGVVHYDIKPANMLYTPARGALLCDFGLSHAQQAAFTGGTCAYMPPESIEMELRGFAGDIWAFGVAMLYLLRKITMPDQPGHESTFSLDDLFGKDAERYLCASNILLAWTIKLENFAMTLPTEDKVYNLVTQMLNTSQEDRINAIQVMTEAKAAVSARRPSLLLQRAERPPSDLSRGR